MSKPRRQTEPQGSQAIKLSADPPTCSTCTHYALGRCRRYPKVPVSGPAGLAGWAYPPHEPHETCGEHKRCES